MICGAWMTISPISPAGRVFVGSSASTMMRSTSGNGMPTEPFFCIGHQRCRAREAELDAAPVDFALACHRVIEQTIQQRRNGADERRLDLVYLLEDVAKISRIRRQRNRIVIDQREALNSGVRIRMKEREWQHDGVDPLVHRRLQPFAELKTGDD